MRKQSLTAKRIFLNACLLTIAAMPLSISVRVARPDKGIARDYGAYRAANRDKLRRYWLEVVIGVK